MKTSQYSASQLQGILIALALLRQDTLLFSRISQLNQKNYQQHQQNLHSKSQHVNSLNALEDLRIEIQQKIVHLLSSFDHQNGNRSQLFGFSSKIYKIVKLFHQKFANFWPQKAENLDVQQFLHNLRIQSISKISNLTFSEFVSMILKKLSERYKKELNVYSYRLYDPPKHSKYSILTKATIIELFISSNFRILGKMNLQINMRQIRQQNNPYKDLLDIEENDNTHENYWIRTKNDYLKEGLCDILSGRHERIQKYLVIKNYHNEKIIRRHVEKYREYQVDEKFNLGQLKEQTNNKNSMPRSISNHSKVEDRARANFLIKKSNYTAKTLDLTQRKCSEENEQLENINNQAIQEQSQTQKENQGYKTIWTAGKKRSNTLKPLIETKQNRSVLTQKVTFIKLEIKEAKQEQKGLKARRKRLIPIQKENSMNKLSMNQSLTFGFILN